MKKILIGVIVVTVLLMAGVVFIETRGNDKNKDFPYKVCETDDSYIIIDQNSIHETEYGTEGYMVIIEK